MACIKDFDTCQWPGGTRYCCSGHCAVNQGQNFGKCGETTTTSTSTIPNTVFKEACLRDGVKCQPDGSLGSCCSQNCFKLESDEFGICRGSSTSDQPPTVATTTTPSSKCAGYLGAEERCLPDGSLGMCCSLNCFQLAGEPYGKCRGSEPPANAPASCIKSGGNCTLEEGLPLGVCCGSDMFCDVRMPHKYGYCEPMKQSSLSSTNLVLISGGVLAVLIALVIGFVWLFYRQKKVEDSLSEKEMEHFFKGDSESARFYGFAHEATDNLPYNKELEISQYDFTIDMNSQLGAGCFGLVLKGVVRGEEVAVKTLKTQVNNASHLRSLLSEIKVLQYIGKFENVVSIVGCYTENLAKGKVFLFLEYCPLGSLDKYLRKYKFSYSGKPETHMDRLYENISVEIESATLNSKLLLQWCQQIANAMKFLSGKKVIHADLATRNILLLRRDCAKITDFGLSRKLYEYGNYVKKNQEPLPWRWLALESLTEMTFSHMSDVWAMGVTFWEIYTIGEIPYPGLNWNQDFMECLRGNLRPSKPPHASNELYELMLDCWKPVPNSRPTFEEIYMRLKNLERTTKSTEISRDSIFRPS